MSATNTPNPTNSATEKKHIIPIRENGLKMIQTVEGKLKVASCICIFISLLIIWIGHIYMPASQAIQFFGLLYWIWLLIDIILELFGLKEKVPDFLKHVIFLTVAYAICLLGITICSIIMITTLYGSFIAAGIFALASQVTLVLWLIRVARLFKEKVAFV